MLVVPFWQKLGLIWLLCNLSNDTRTSCKMFGCKSMGLVCNKKNNTKSTYKRLLLSQLYGVRFPRGEKNLSLGPWARPQKLPLKYGGEPALTLSSNFWSRVNWLKKKWEEDFVSFPRIQVQPYTILTRTRDLSTPASSACINCPL